MVRTGHQHRGGLCLSVADDRSPILIQLVGAGRWSGQGEPSTKPPLGQGDEPPLHPSVLSGSGPRRRGHAIIRTAPAACGTSTRRPRPADAGRLPIDNLGGADYLVRKILVHKILEPKKMGWG